MGLPDFSESPIKSNFLLFNNRSNPVRPNSPATLCHTLKPELILKIRLQLRDQYPFLLHGIPVTHSHRMVSL